MIDKQSMHQTPTSRIAESPAESLIDVSGYAFDLLQIDSAAPAAALVDRVVRAVVHGPGFALLHGGARLVAAHGLDVHTAEGAEAARRAHEAVFRAALGRIDVARHSPVTMAYDRVARMDVDGYNRNRGFTPNADHTEAREFITTKCVHFDAATPFIANIYGPNQNIKGGLPMICDTRAFCRDRGIDPRTLIENIPNNYNVAVRHEYCGAILAHYSVALDVDLANDVVAVILFNEVVGGLAHAATPPEPIDAGQPTRRPIRHIELQVANTDDLKTWYDYYGLSLTKAADRVDAKPAMFERYHRGEAAARTVQVGS